MDFEVFRWNSREIELNAQIQKIQDEMEIKINELTRTIQKENHEHQEKMKKFQEGA